MKNKPAVCWKKTNLAGLKMKRYTEFRSLVHLHKMADLLKFYKGIYGEMGSNLSCLIDDGLLLGWFCWKVQISFFLHYKQKPSVLSHFALSFVPLAFSPHFTTVALYFTAHFFHSTLLLLCHLSLECSEGRFNMLVYTFLNCSSHVNKRGCQKLMLENYKSKTSVFWSVTIIY